MSDFAAVSHFPRAGLGLVMQLIGMNAENQLGDAGLWTSIIFNKGPSLCI